MNSFSYDSTTQIQKYNINPKEYYIFSTCRLCYLNHPNIKHIKKLKKLHSNYYTINNNNLYTQPVNYTVKLTEILDSIWVLKTFLFGCLFIYSCLQALDPSNRP